MSALVKKNVFFDFDADIDDDPVPDKNAAKPKPSAPTPAPSTANTNKSTPQPTPSLHKKSERFTLIELPIDKQPPPNMVMGINTNPANSKKSSKAAENSKSAEVNEDSINVFFTMIKNIEMSLN